MAAIRFEGVSKQFGDVQALDDVSFEIHDNAFFCLFGPPLSGKSTILKIILGLEEPDKGDVYIDNKLVNNASAASRNVAMVFQNLALFPHMTAEQNVRFPLEERKIDGATITARVKEVSDKLHMSHILHKPPSQLSGGERQRVAIARALVRDAQAYLMDDPISALDARLREETRFELRRIQRDMGKTLVYVTHDQEEAMSVADAMLVLQDGKVVQQASPHELYERPNSVYVASMLGSPTINLLPAAKAGLLGGGNAPPEAAAIGVRPEDLRLTHAPNSPVRIAEVEPLGGFTTITLELDERQMHATLRGQPSFSAGQKVALSVDPARLHFFDKSDAALAKQL